MFKNIQQFRLFIQISVFILFLVHGFLYYLIDFKPFGNMLPFMAYASIGKQVISSALIVWVLIAISTFIFGRVVCGWFCPFGLIQDLGEKLLIKLNVKLPKPQQHSRLARLLLLMMVLFTFIILPLLSSSVVVWQFDLNFQEPWLLKGPFLFGLFLFDLLLIFLVLGLLLPYIFGPRPYCKMVCETGFLLEQFSKNSFGRIRRNEGFDVDTCIECNKCNITCPQAISIYQEVALFDKVVDSECITCLQCIETCPNDTIVYSLAKKVSDTGKVAGYVNAQKNNVHDIKRFIIMGSFTVLGGFIGFWIIPPSYIHTYLLLASLFSIIGFYVFKIFFSKQTIEVQTVGEVQTDLSKKEMMKMKPKKVNLGVKRGVVATLILSGVLGFMVYKTAPLRISDISEVTNNENTIIFGVPNVLSTDESSQYLKLFKKFLEKETGEKIRLVTAKSYSELGFSIEKELIDIAILPPVAYRSLSKRAPKSFIPLVQQTFHNKRVYSAILISNKAFKKDIKSDMFASTIAFTAVDSYSGYIEAEKYIHTLGLELSDFKEVIFTQNHSKSIALLSAKRVDYVATFDGALESYQKHHQVNFFTKVLNDKVPNDVIVVRSNLSTKKRESLLRALLLLNKKLKDFDTLNLGFISY